MLQQDMDISIHQHWGFFLDSKRNFWVFSSDVGDGIWEKDSVTSKYYKCNNYFALKLEKSVLETDFFKSLRDRNRNRI